MPLATEDYPEYKNKTGVEAPVSLGDVQNKILDREKIGKSSNNSPLLHVGLAHRKSFGLDTENS